MGMDSWLTRNTKKQLGHRKHRGFGEMHQKDQFLCREVKFLSFRNGGNACSLGGGRDYIFYSTKKPNQNKIIISNHSNITTSVHISDIQSS